MYTFYDFLHSIQHIHYSDQYTVHVLYRASQYRTRGWYFDGTFTHYYITMTLRITFHYATELLDDLLEASRDIQEYKDGSDKNEDEVDEYAEEEDGEVGGRTKRHDCK